MNKKLKRKQALIMAEPYRTPFNSKVAKVNGDVIEDSVGEIKYATSFNGATKIEDGNKNKIKIKDGVYSFGKSVNLAKLNDQTFTQNGVSVVIKDGVITFSGTATASGSMRFDFVSNITEVVDTTYYWATFNNKIIDARFGIITNETSGSYTAYEDLTEVNKTRVFLNATARDIIAFFFKYNNGTNFDGFELKPMIIQSSTAPTKYYSGSYGIKIEVADGVVTCNGMLASDSEQNFWYNFELPISSGIYSANIFLRSSNINVYLSHGLYDWANSYQIAVKEATTAPLSSINVKTDCTYMFLSFDKEHDYDNLVLKPMLVLGTTAPTSFEPNFKNLIEFDDLEEKTFDNIKYSIKNGIITINGTTNGTYSIIYYQEIQNLLEDGATYSYNDISNNKYFYMQIDLFKIDGSFQFLPNKNRFTWSTSVYSKCVLKVQSNDVATSFDNLEIKPTLVKSSVMPTQFIPFANPYFVSLGQNGSVQYNGLEPREIDLKGNVISKINNQASDKLSNYALTKNTKVVDLGSLTWEFYDTNTANIKRIGSFGLVDDLALVNSSNVKGNILCTKYETVTGDETYNKYKGIAAGPTGAITIYDPDYNTSDKLEDFKKAIRGTLLMYQTKNPTTINTTSFKTFKEDTNATIGDDNFTSSTNAITETFKPTRSYDFKVNGFSNLIKSSNLFFLPNIASATLGGLTYSASNQKMTVSGTNTYRYVIFYSIDMTDKMVEGKTYVLQCSNGSLDLMLQANILKSDGTYAYYNSYDNSRFTWTSNYTQIWVIAQNSSVVGTTINLSNITFGLYETDNISIPYEPYFDSYIESFADKKNLLDLSQISDIAFSTQDNQTITFNKHRNGVYLIKDYPLENGTYEVSLILKTKLTTSKTFNYIVSGTTENSLFTNFENFTLNEIKTKQIEVIENKLSIILWIDGYQEFDFQMMVVKGKTPPTTFLPYKDKYSAFLNVKGKNLLALPDTKATTIGGITYSIKDGVITLNGTTTGTLSLKLENIVKVEENQTYYFYQKTENTVTTFYLVSNPSNYSAEPTFFQYNNKSKKMTKTGYLTVHLYITNPTTFTNAKFYLMLVEGSTAPTEFEPYYSFTKEVLINQPLRKFDYLTYEGVYRQTNEIVLDGTNNLFISDSGAIQLLNLPNVDSLNTDYAINYASQLMVTTSDLPLVPCRDIQVENKKGIGTNNGVIYLKLDDSTDNSLNNWTVEKVNNYFKQNPITITYKTVDQTFEATSLTRLLLKNGYNKITPYDSINNNAIVEYLEYYKNKGD